jgi:hypothetical protein
LISVRAEVTGAFIGGITGLPGDDAVL